jgi:hypothetical protein
LGRQSAIHDAWSTVNAIIKGDGPLFNGLEDHERLSLLSEILDMGRLASPALVKLAAADEIARRLGSVEPSPAERQRIEVEAQDDPHPDSWACGMH